MWSLLAACATVPTSPTTTPTAGETGDSGALPVTDGCTVPAELAHPHTIAQVFDLIDALPGPTVDVPCILEALERPLGVELTMNVLSAQPADSVHSPRTFIEEGGVVLSVVPDGPGRPLMEFAEDDPSGLTVKAELAFPVTLPLDRDLAYERILSDQVTVGTRCGLCHWDETEVSPGRWASIPLRPTFTTLVDVEDLRQDASACDPTQEPDRCSFLSALFDHGPVVHQPFPDDVPTIYDH